MLLIGGGEPSGSAGVAGDVVALARVGVSAAVAITAVTVQTEREVVAIHPVPAEVVAAQVRAALDAGVRAVSIGMLYHPDIVEACAVELARAPIPIVLDPVLRASGGGSLAADGLVEALAILQPLVSVVTPNRTEAVEVVHADPQASSEDLARTLRSCGWSAVCVTGGDDGEAEAIDILAYEERVTALVAPRVSGVSPRGTGGAFASLIAAGLAEGLGIEDGCRRAKGMITRMIRAAQDGRLGEPVSAALAGHPFE